MSNEAAKKEFPEKDQRLAVAYSKWRKRKKESMYFISRFEMKESEDDNLIVGGYIATTHLDSGFYDADREVWIRDKISKDTLQKWADEINSGNPRANKVSINHNREPHVAGVAIKGSAKVEELSDGNFGLYTDTLIDCTKDNFKDTSYRLDNNLLDSFSIEFSTRDPMSDSYFDGAVVENNVEGGVIRTLMPGTILEGYTLASQPMNEHAVRIKEIIPKKQKEDKLEMTEKKEEETAPEEEPKEEAPEEEAKEAVVTSKDKKEISKEDWKEFEAYRAEMRKEMEIKTVERLVDKKLQKLKEELELKEKEVEEKVQKNTDKIESKELKEFSEMIKGKEASPAQMRRIAGKISDMCGFTDKGEINGKTRSVESRSYDFEIKQVGCKHVLEYKNLGITTNQNTDTDYLLSAAELSDVFDPLIFNMLYQPTVTWNVLQKDDMSNKGNNLAQFTGKTAANSTACAYTGNAVTTGNVTRLKFQTKFKKYQVGVAVDGDMIAAARGGPIGDVFAREVQDSTVDLLQAMNQDLFAEVGLETASGVIGFEYICDNAGNATLYNLTRNTTNLLAPDSNTDTYINGSSQDITLSNLRQAKRQALKEGAMLENLFFVCDHIQGDKFRGIFDSQQRTVPTSSRFGFEGRPEFDGIPIFEDKDCNDDDWFLVDLETHRIGIWVPPTLERLGKDSDAEKGFIKTYWCTYNRAPRRMVMIYGNAT